MKFFNKGVTPDLDELIAGADRLRDTKAFAAAAEAYAAALEVAPDRTGLRVQLGNMLKDSGRPDQAAEAYRRALSENPDDADIHLQLGHALKLQAKRSEARDAYRNATRCPGGSAAAERELINLGETDFLMTPGRISQAQAAQDAAGSLSLELGALKAQLSRIEAALPDLSLARSFPPEAWAALREKCDVPPRSGAAELRFVINAATLEVRDAHLMVAALASQHHARWTARFIGATAHGAEAIARLVVAEPRIELAEDMAAALTGAPSLTVLIGGAALPHEFASGWIAHCADRFPETGFTCDAEHVSVSPDGLVPMRAQIGAVADPETIEENGYAGALLCAPKEVLLAALQAGPHDFRSWMTAAALVLAREGRLGHIPLPLVRIVDGRDAKIADPAPQPPPARAAQATIAVIVPTRDNGPDVMACVDSLLAAASSPACVHIVVVDNGSVNPATHSILGALKQRDRVTVVRLDQPFNWSHLNNEAAKTAASDILVFANDDMLIRSRGWDGVLDAYLARPEIGAVGACLRYPDGHLQHAGMIAGWRQRFIHDGLDAPPGAPGPDGRWTRVRRVAAVTGAFLAVRRRDFEDAGGFDAARFAISYGDVDLCFRLREKALAILWTPRIEAMHYETKTRGADAGAPEKRARDEAEAVVFRSRWGAAADSDPSLNPWWAKDGRPFRLLQAPGQDAIDGYISLTARRRPWSIVRHDVAAGAGLENAQNRQE